MTEERIVIPRERVTYEYEGETKYVETLCLAQLLLDDAIFLNDGRAASSGNETICAFVHCNDIFAWAFADLEPVLCHELPDLYEMHMADPLWGAAKWTIKRRGEMPQPPVLQAMQEKGVWDLDESQLRANTTDAETQALFAQAAALSRQQQQAQGDPEKS